LGRHADPAATLDAIQAVEVRVALVQQGLAAVLGSREADGAAAEGLGPRVDGDRFARGLDTSSNPSPARVAGPTDSLVSHAVGANGAGGLVDLNHAGASELQTLPGTGPVTALKVIAARKERPFAGIEELRDRKLVGKAAYAKLKHLVTVTGRAEPGQPPTVPPTP
jgi:competence protein ComEA